jgi:hypothetical protein
VKWRRVRVMLVLGVLAGISVAVVLLLMNDNNRILARARSDSRMR